MRMQRLKQNVSQKKEDKDEVCIFCTLNTIGARPLPYETQPADPRAVDEKEMEFGESGEEAEVEPIAWTEPNSSEEEDSLWWKSAD